MRRLGCHQFEIGTICQDLHLPLMGFKAIDDRLLPTRGEVPEKQPGSCRGQLPRPDVNSCANRSEAVWRVAEIVETGGAEIVLVHEDAIRWPSKFPIYGNGPADIVTVMEAVAV